MIRKLTYAVGGGMLLTTILFNACTEETPEVDCASGDLALTVTNVQGSECNQANGSLTVSGAGGDGNYTFSIDGTNFQESGTFSGLSSDSYTITVRDGAECTATENVSVNDLVDITMNISTTEAGCDESNGAITVDVSGDGGPFTYSISEGSFQASPTFSNLGRGIYIVRVRDEDGCSVAESVEVLSGLSLSADIKPIIETNCAVSGCHVAGTGLPNYNNNSTIISLAPNIKSRTQSGIMPPPSSGRSLTDAEIQQIACWVDDGAPNN